MGEEEDSSAATVALCVRPPPQPRHRAWYMAMQVDYYHTAARLLAWCSGLNYLGLIRPEWMGKKHGPNLASEAPDTYSCGPLSGVDPEFLCKGFSQYLGVGGSFLQC